MSATTVSTQDLHTSSGFAARWADAMRRTWPRRGSAKRVASIVGASPRTVEGWFDGHLPGARHLAQMMARNEEFQREFLALVEQMRKSHVTEDGGADSASH